MSSECNTPPLLDKSSSSFSFDSVLSPIFSIDAEELASFFDQVPKERVYASLLLPQLLDLFLSLLVMPSLLAPTQAIELYTFRYILVCICL